MISRKQFEARFTYSLDDEKINYVEANDILDTLNVNDRYKNIEENLEKLEILIYKNWEDEHGDKMMKAYNEITLFFTDRTSTQKNIINTQETQKNIILFMLTTPIVRKKLTTLTMEKGLEFMTINQMTNPWIMFQKPVNLKTVNLKQKQ